MAIVREFRQPRLEWHRDANPLPHGQIDSICLRLSDVQGDIRWIIGEFDITWTESGRGHAFWVRTASDALEALRESRDVLDGLEALQKKQWRHGCANSGVVVELLVSLGFHDATARTDAMGRTADDLRLVAHDEEQLRGTP